MRLRSLYISLSFLTVTVLLGGIGFIYFDGQKEITLDRETSQNDIEKSLLVMTYFSKYRSFIQTSNIPLHSFEREFNKLLILQKSVSEKLIQNEKPALKLAASLCKEYYDKTKNSFLLKQNLLLLEKQSHTQWKEIESFMSHQVIKYLKDGQEFLPNFKSTLSKWGESIPLFEKLKNSIDVSFLQQDKFIELKEIMTFSNWLLKWKLDINEKKINLNDSSKKIKEKVNSSRINSALKSKIRSKSDDYIKALKKLNQANSQYLRSTRILRTTRSKANEFLTQNLIPHWQGSLNQKLEQTVLSKIERHQSIVQIAIIMGIFIILVMSLLFLSIFPFLNTLEQKAKLVGKGNFLAQIDKKIPKNEIGQVMNAFNDMTNELSKYLKKIKKHEQEKTQLMNSIQKMRRINELGEFSAKMAHELKNPLSILNFCLKDALEASVKGDNQLSTKELKKSLHALERLKVISGRLGAKSTFTEPECINVKQMILELVSMYDSLISKEDVSIKIRAEDDNTIIEGPKLELMGALSNLLDNAIEYFMTNKVKSTNIDVRIRNDVSDVFIEIASQGKQLEESNRLFNSFYSDKTSITRGMGLVIVKDIVESIGGVIDYIHEKETNKFTIKLPVSQRS